MACNAAGLVDGETVGSPKLAELATLLEEVCVDDGRKVVVFSQWEKMTRMAEAVARRLGLGVVRLHGGVVTHRRGELIDRFHDDAGTQVFLSTDAGGVGLNLQAASVLINLDLPWNPAVLEQRIARVHRRVAGDAAAGQDVETGSTAEPAHVEPAGSEGAKPAAGADAEPAGGAGTEPAAQAWGNR